MNATKSLRLLSRLTVRLSVWLGVGLGAIGLGRLAAQGESSAIARPLAPAVAAETVPPAPSPQHQWIAGAWSWDGQYRWIAGHWDLPPVPNATWYPARWDRRDPGYVLINGSWQATLAPAPAVAAPPVPPVTITAGAPPPSPQTDVIGPRPGPGYVWTPGYWTWSAGQYVWTAGHWTQPPRPEAAWVEPRWEQRGSGYVFVPGYWQGSDGAPVPAAVVVPAPAPPAPATSISVQVGPAAPPPPGPPEIYVRAGPPPSRREYTGPRPSPYHIWISGYWRWRGGRYVWVDGHWELPPRGRVWVEPRWEHRGNGYIFLEGTWR